MSDNVSIEDMEHAEHRKLAAFLLRFTKRELDIAGELFGALNTLVGNASNADVRMAMRGIRAQLRVLEEQSSGRLDAISRADALSALDTLLGALEEAGASLAAAAPEGGQVDTVVGHISWVVDEVRECSLGFAEPEFP